MASLTNQEIVSHEFLLDMYNDEYFPNFLVDKVKQILIKACEQIEDKKPESESDLLLITHLAVEKINALEEEFEENDSELETGAREAMAASFEFIVKAYGFNDVDIEEVIAPREW